MRKIIAAAVVVGSMAFVPLAQAQGPVTPPPLPAESFTFGLFTKELTGVSAFFQAGDQLTVRGRYRNLLPANRAFFTVLYANEVCDPAQAFPVGPFITNNKGRANLRQTVTAPPGLVAGTLSVSIRRGDNDNDRDGDGLTGPTDVVAVPGNPRVGLVECDT